MQVFDLNLTLNRTDLFAVIKKLREKGELRRDLVVSFGLALMTGLGAQVRIPLPFSPVPVTGQVFVVLAIGFIFGKRLGVISQIVYTGLGGLGLPWFAGLAGGVSVLAGPTGGYVLGFLPAVYLVGWLSERVNPERLDMKFIVGVVGLAAIYCSGLAQLSLSLNIGLAKAVRLGVVPFVWIDLMKLLVLTILIKGLDSGGKLTN